MKTSKIVLILVLIITVAMFAFRTPAGGSIKGTVVPADGALRVWALSGTDTFKTTANNMGMFEMTNVRPGTYRVLVEANSPYQNAFKDNVSVSDGAVTDAGDFKVSR